MAYSDPPGTNWGCIAAGAFLFLLGLPMLAGIAMADVCLSPEGCVDKRLMLVITLAAVIATSFAILWLVNWLSGRGNRLR